MQEQDNDLAALKALAEAATPGPWYSPADYQNQVFAPDRHATALAKCNYGEFGSRQYDTEDVANARWVAAANPAAILSLISRIDQQAARIEELEAENDKVRVALGDATLAATMMHELSIKDGGINAAFSGGAAQLLAEAFGDQFTKSGATNYLEVGFNTSAGVRLLVTLQRVDGKTPSQLQREAEQERDELRERLAHPTPAVDLSGLTHKFEEIRSLLEEAYGFKSTSPVAQRNINDALGLLTEIEVLSAPVVREGKMTDSTAEVGSCMPPFAAPAGQHGANSASLLAALDASLPEREKELHRVIDSLQDKLRAMQKATAAGVAKLADEHIDRMWTEAKGDSTREITHNFARAIEREVLATGKEVAPSTQDKRLSAIAANNETLTPAARVMAKIDACESEAARWFFRESPEAYVRELVTWVLEFATPSTPSQAWNGELPTCKAPKGPFADYSAEEVEAFAADYARKAIGAAVAGVREQALEDAAEKLDSMNDSAGDRASYDNREMTCCELERMRTLSRAADAIRSLSSNPVSLTEKVEQQPFAYLPKSELAKLDYPRAARGMYVFKEPGEGRVAIYLAPHPVSNGNGEKGGSDE